MSDYYQILGLNSSATAAEIKQRFRQLVVQYHPDKNPDPRAADRIREINEAYDVLGDPDRKRAYDNRFRAPIYQTPQPPPHRDPAYHRARQYRKPSVSNQFVLMQQCMPYIKKLNLFSLVFCGFLLLDFILPRIEQEEVVISKQSYITNSRGRSYHSSDMIYTNKGTHFQVDLDDTGPMKEGRIIYIKYSRIQRIPIRVSDHSIFSVRIPVTIFGNFIFAPIVLLALSVLAYYYRNNVSMSFNLGTTIFFILLLCFYFLKIS